MCVGLSHHTTLARRNEINKTNGKRDQNSVVEMIVKTTH